MFEKMVKIGAIAIISIIVTGCAFVENVKYNFIQGDVPEVEVVILKSDSKLTIAQKQIVLESIVGARCLIKNSDVDYININKERIQETVEFSECLEATKDGYKINFSSESDISKKFAMRFAKYEKLGIRVTDAKLKIQQLYPEKSKNYKSIEEK